MVVKFGIKADYLFWEHLGSVPRFSLGLLPHQPDATKTGIFRRGRGKSSGAAPLGEGKAGAAGIPGSERVGMRSSFSLPTAGAIPRDIPAPSLSRGIKPGFLSAGRSLTVTAAPKVCQSEVKAIFKVYLQV